jgi:branched-chain amino acid transport system permease protein
MSQPVRRRNADRLLRLAPWLLSALALVAAPLLFDRSAALSILCQAGTMMIFALSFNMLLGQAGMLSFGHAVYSGLGAYGAIHLLRTGGAGDWQVPVSLVPLAGGLAGMAFAALTGYLTTRRAGTTFAMITMGMAELVAAGAAMFPGWFGGEGGIGADRVMGAAVFGVTFGPQIEVYYLIAAWLFVCTLAMYGFTRTPLGRLANAVRDNAERVEFIGHDPRLVRYLTLVVSAFFAGVSGGLAAINFEVVTPENLGAVRSGTVLLFTFIGGTAYFVGPLAGALVGVLMTSLLPAYTQAWQLWLGLLFIAMVMLAPGGIASLMARAWRAARRARAGG